jgi:hypothetical protein
LAPFNQDHPDLGGIVLSQPPHQQRFSFGHAYDPKTKSFEFNLRRLYILNPPSGEWPALDLNSPTPNPSEALAASKIDSTYRVLQTTELASAINKGIQLQVGGDHNHLTSAYIDYVPNSAELALELNDPAYYFTIYPQKPDASGTKYTSDNTIQRVRQLWTSQVTAAPSTVTVPAAPIQVSAPIGAPMPIQPPKASIVPITENVPGQAGKITVQDHPVIPASTSTLPPTQMPKKCFTMDVFVDYKGLRLRKDGAYDPGDYIPIQSKYLLGQ